MSKTFKIFTCGSGCNHYDNLDWRRKIEIMLRRSTDKDLSFAHPPYYSEYFISSDLHNLNSKDYLAWEQSNIQDSDIVIVNTDGINDSATCFTELAFQLGFIAGLNRLGKNITVIGFGESKIDHPWLSTVFSHTETNMEDAVDYITNLALI